MSDFLVNLLRRGAGLQPVATPRRPDLPAEMEETAPRDDRREAGDGLPALAAQAGAAPEIDGRRPDEEALQPPPAAARPVPGPPAGGLPPARPTAAASATARVAERREEGRHPQAPVLASAPPPAERSTEAARRPPRPGDAPAPGDDLREPRPPLPAAEIATPALARTADVAAAPTSPAPPATPVPPAAPARALPAARSPLAALTPDRPPSGPRVSDPAGGEEEPRIEVRIGRIEIRTPLASAPAPRRAPRGFAEHALARRYLDRRWS
jgi:hypothetical protein